MRKSFPTNSNARAQRATVLERVKSAVARVVHVAVERHKQAGDKGEFAMRAAARDLGIEPRRVKAWLYGEARSVPVDEVEVVLARAERILDLCAANMRAKAAAQEAKLREMRRQCIALENSLHAHSTSRQARA